ncbi:MAG TPA: TetR family transcriptional regulator [Amycolatopsis sp.]|nr:TetR family transcriptional regulator [Amycolatopsis sp.]
MSRWEPNARERLARAAVDLFAERGYDATTVAEIAERAGLTKRTFFRYFADKREVLFGGQEILRRLFIDGITGAPGSATPAEALAAALEAVAAAFPQERLEQVRQRQAVVALHTELQERELLKAATLTAAMAESLRERGVPEPDASVAAELGTLAFRMSFARWVDPVNDREFADLARETLGELRTAAAAMGG